MEVELPGGEEGESKEERASWPVIPSLSALHSLDPSEMFTELHREENRILPSIRDFSNESAHPIRWPNYWSFSLTISPSNEYSGVISFRIDWCDLLE